MRLSKRKYAWSELSGWKKNEWVIEGLLKKGQVALLTGNPKAGKSFIALRAAAAVTSGDKFFGRPAMEGNVLYLAAERALTLEDRGQALIESRVPFNTENIEVFPKPVAFLDENEVTSFINEVGQTDLIIIDTLRRCFAGGRENDNNDMTAWVYGVERFCEETGSAAIVIHHNQRKRYDTRGRVVDGDFAGGGALLGSVDCQIQVSKGANGLIRLVEVESNSKASFESYARIDSVTLRSGTQVGMAVEVVAGAQFKLDEEIQRVMENYINMPLSDIHKKCMEDGIISEHWKTLSKEGVRKIVSTWESTGLVESIPSPVHSQQRLYTFVGKDARK